MTQRLAVETYCSLVSLEMSACVLPAQIPLLCLCLLLNEPIGASEVLLVVGGVYRNVSTRRNVPLSSVEVIGPRGTCEVAPLPEPRQSLFVARVGNSVFACGGFHIYERSECFEYIPELQRWIQGPSLSGPLIFAGAVSLHNQLVIVGGRRFNHRSRGWDYFSDLQVWDPKKKSWSRPYPPVPMPVADACVFTHGQAIIIIGGSDGMYQYIDDPGKSWILINGTWSDSVVPPILGPRMWHACEVVRRERQAGFIVVGGYYNGYTTMYWPLQGPSRWDWRGPLNVERKWKPVLGVVNGELIAASGGNYGDGSIEVYDGYQWNRRRDSLKYKREYAGHTKVPHHWFPQCRFVI